MKPILASTHCKFWAIKAGLCLVWFAALAGHLALPLYGTSYFIAPTGSDTNSGTNQAAPWQSLAKVNSRVFQPGDQILFQAGGTWAGELHPQGSGTANAPILLGAHGNGAKPIIDAHGAKGSAAIKLYNQEYWTIQGLEVANWGSDYGRRFGILIFANDGCIKHGLKILDNTVRDIFASPIQRPNTNSIPDFYSVGGIYIKISEPGHAENVLIQGNCVSNIVGEGICFWAESEFVGGMNWSNLSPGVVVRRNLVSRTAGDGILILGTDNELLEHNRVEYAGQLGVTNGTECVAGLWPTRHRNGLCQFNEVGHTKRWNTDGEGFDNDLLVQGTTIFQYNYSHDNEGGFLLDCCEPDGGHTIARYNISIGESIGQLCRNNATFYNNVFYRPNQPVGLRLNSGSLPTNQFQNNIFWCPGLDTNFAAQVLSHNVYFGGATPPANDINGLAGDPRFVNPNTNGVLEGFKLLPDSPCLGSGATPTLPCARDFFGCAIPPLNPVNRGVDNSLATLQSLVHENTSKAHPP